MNAESLGALQPLPQTPPRSARLVGRLLQNLRQGRLHVACPDGRSMMYGDNGEPVTLAVADYRVFDAVLTAGDIGFAEAYIDGHWSTDRLPQLLEVLARNRTSLEAAIYGSRWAGLLYRLRHLLNRNSRRGSRRNIHAHYDIGNDFYRLWLDPSMTYSSALFADDDATDLQHAQRAKYRRMLGALALEPGARVLELGCGWGGFAEIAAEAGAHVTGITLSSEQLHYARRRLAQAGLSQSADLRLQDYRDVEGEFDAIASIEMFEAVGEAYWPAYFACIADRLKAGGRACIQTIVIADDLFARYRKGSDFIQQYIFPGGMLPSPSVFRSHAARHGLRVLDDFAFGRDYARTLAEWRTAFHERLAAIRDQGFDERFIRTWDFYLAYCEAGFRAGSIDVIQFTLEKPAP